MEGGKKVHGDDRDESWHAKGHDYGTNFTLNICAPVIEDLEDVVEVDKARWRNVSAFYRSDGKTYSIGWVDFLYSVMEKVRGSAVAFHKLMVIM